MEEQQREAREAYARALTMMREPTPDLVAMLRRLARESAADAPAVVEALRERICNVSTACGKRDKKSGG